MGPFYVRGCNAPGRWVDHHHDGGFMRTTACLAAVLAATTLATAVAAAQNGNGAPNGTHYSLNIIGVPRDKSSNPDWTSGHVIFVNLGSKNVTVTTKILLSQSTASVCSTCSTRTAPMGKRPSRSPPPVPTPSGRAHSGPQ